MASMLTDSGGYVDLLSHLKTPTLTTRLPLDVLCSSIAYYLVHSPPSIRGPTALAAAIVSSAYFRPSTYENASALSAVFQRATSAKWQLLQHDETGLFGRSASSRWDEWIKAVLEGLQAASNLLRVALLGGILKSIKEVSQSMRYAQPAIQGQIEAGITAAMVDAFDATSNESRWDADFHEHGTIEETRDLLLIVSSEPLLLLPRAELSKMPLGLLSSRLITLITSTFLLLHQSVHERLQSAGLSVKLEQSSKVPPSPASEHVRMTPLTSPGFGSMPFLSKLVARIIAISVDTQPDQAMDLARATLVQLKSLSAIVAEDWSHSPLATANAEHLNHFKEEAEQEWAVLKTMLFTNVMISQAILSAMAYLPKSSPSEALSQLALTVLDILSDLSFVVSQFGGIQSSSGSGFTELKRVAYAALDILASDGLRSEQFVIHSTRGSTVSRSIRSAEITDSKLAFTLTCIEQLVPALSDTCIMDAVVPLCLKYVNDPSHRECYEASHSVMVAILAESPPKDSSVLVGAASPPPARQLVPFYLDCLIENSRDGRLNVDQLHLAFLALVRAASAALGHVEAVNGSREPLAWYCIETALSTIRAVALDGDEARAHRLRLSVISAIPALPRSLLGRTLEDLRVMLGHIPVADERKQLSDALFHELLQNIGDENKQFAMGWWAQHQDELRNHFVG